MFRLLTRVQIAYICLFFIVCAAVFAYQAVYIWPIERCQAHGGWWSARYRQCATPIPIWRFTGRFPAALAGAPGQRVAPGVQSTSPRP